MSDEVVERVREKAIEIVALGKDMPLKEFIAALVIARSAVDAYIVARTPYEKTKEWDQWPRSQD